MPKLAAIYARVSSAKQKEGETINSQLFPLQKMAEERGYLIPNGWVFKDDGISGATLQRPALDELRAQIHEGDVDAVFIYSPDRLSRKYAYLLLLEMEFQKCNTELIFFNTPKASNPEEQLSLHFKAIFAEYERAQITERCRRGRLYRARQGNISVVPRAPYGYVFNKKNGSSIASYSVQDNEAQIVKRIYHLFALEQKSILHIARQLQQDGIKSPRGNVKWHQSTIRDILRNPAYTGTTYFGKTEKSEGFSDKIIRTKKGKKTCPPKDRKMRSKELWIPLQVPQIIDEKVFLEARGRLDVNQQLASRNTKEPSILQGLLICKLCGSAYYKKVRNASPNGKRWRYYCCSKRMDTGECKNRSFKQDELDDAIWKYIIDLLKNPVLIEEEIKKRAEDIAQNPQQERRCHEIEKETLRLKRARDKLLDAYQEGDCLTLDDLRKRMKGLDLQRISLEKELQGLQAQAMQNKQNNALKSSLEHFQKCLEKSNTLSIKDKQKVLRMLVDKIVVGTEIEVHHQIPVFENSPLQPDRYL